MPTKYPISRHQLDQITELEKNPFLTTSDIARRIGLSRSIVDRYTHLAHEGKRERVRQAIQDYQSDPQKKLRDPRIWVYAQIYEWAPSRTIEEIFDTLRRLQGEKKVPKGVVLPTLTQIGHIIAEYRFRTHEQARAIVARFNQKRKPNRLTREDREKLLRASRKFVEAIEKQLRKAYGSTAGFHVSEYVEHESRMVRIEPEWEGDRKISTWMSFLKKGRRYIVLKAIRRYKQAQKRESPHTTQLHEETAQKPPIRSESLDSETREALGKIRKRNLEIFLQLTSGEKARIIARRHGLTPTRIHQIKRETIARVRRHRELLLRRQRHG